MRLSKKYLEQIGHIHLTKVQQMRKNLGPISMHLPKCLTLTVYCQQISQTIPMSDTVNTMMAIHSLNT